MVTKSEASRYLHDSPIERLRREDEERRRKSQRGKVLDRQDKELHDLQQRHAAEGRKLDNEHRVERGRDQMLSGQYAEGTGKRKEFEEHRQRERAELTSRQSSERKALAEKHRAELARVRD